MKKKLPSKIEAELKECKSLLESALLLYDSSLDEYNHTLLDSDDEKALSIELNELEEEIDMLRERIAELEKVG